MRITERLAVHRRCLLHSGTLLIALVFSRAARSHEHQAGEALRLGDEGYEHDRLHPLYQAFFDGKCPCSIGECRPTRVEPDATVADTGMRVLIDGEFYPVPKSALKFRKNIPPELLEYQAHVCAGKSWQYGKLLPRIECVVYNGAT